MGADNRFGGLLGSWPPSGLPPLPQPDPTQGAGLLQAPPAQPTLGGVLGVPFDPTSLTGPPFDPLHVIAGGPTGPLSLGDLDWPQALQALHARLLGGQPLTPPLADPDGYGTAAPRAGAPGSPTAGFSTASGQGGLDPNSSSADFAPFGRVPGFHPSQPSQPATVASTSEPAPQTGDTASPRTIGPNGWQPSPGDEVLLARLIFAETGVLPDDSGAVGWSTVNGIRPHQTLADALQRKNGFQSLQAGGGPAGGSAQWQASADPSQLTDGDAKSWAAAQTAAAGIINGSIPDPTGGATQFFSSTNYNPINPKTAPGDFPRMLREQRIAPSAYQGHAKGSYHNYFFVNK